MLVSLQAGFNEEEGNNRAGEKMSETLESG